jgi:uncharacterized membrane protein YhaH (DUF805 family)
MSMINFLLMLGGDVSGDPAATGGGIFFMLLALALTVLMIAAMWRVFEKAGEPGWAALIPIYNLYILLKIAGKPAWWLLLFVIPFVNFIAVIMVALAIARNFGKGVGFGLGLLVLGPVFYPILAWGDSRYQRQTA